MLRCKDCYWHFFTHLWWEQSCWKKSSPILFLSPFFRDFRESETQNCCEFLLLLGFITTLVILFSNWWKVGFLIISLHIMEIKSPLVYFKSCLFSKEKLKENLKFTLFESEFIRGQWPLVTFKVSKCKLTQSWSLS